MSGPSFVTFPGLRISRADFVLAHGVTPSACIVSCIPQSTVFTVGPLTIYSDGVPILTFSDCALDHQYTTPPLVKRGQRVTMRILDRRWRWRGKRIDGRYNVRRPDGYPRTATTRSYYELCVLLLDALGETNYEIQLPYPALNGPTVNWSAARADLELAKLVDEIGCIVYLGIDDRVHIAPDGLGPLLPPTGREREPLIDFYPTTVPYAVQTKFGPIRYQSYLHLEAVGLDTDGTVQPIDDLSYCPGGGWSTQIPNVFNDVADDDDRELARRTVYKWYRVVAMADGDLRLPGGMQTITTIDDILPLRPDLIMPQGLSNADPSTFENWPPSRPVVGGYFFNADLTGLPEQGEFGNPNFAYYDGEYEIDCENGIVKFFQPMFDVLSSGHQDPASLYLECAFQARANAYSTDWYYWTKTLTGMGAPESNGVVQVNREDLFLYYVVNVISDTPWPMSVSSNLAVINEIGRQQGESYRNHFTNWPRSNMQWAGILAIPLQGNIHQVRWVFGDGPPMTYASRSSEVPTWGPNFYERRFREEAERNMPSIRR